MKKYFLAALVVFLAGCPNYQQLVTEGQALSGKLSDFRNLLVDKNGYSSFSDEVDSLKESLDSIISRVEGGASRELVRADISDFMVDFKYMFDQLSAELKKHEMPEVLEALLKLEIRVNNLNEAINSSGKQRRDNNDQGKKPVEENPCPSDDMAAVGGYCWKVALVGSNPGSQAGAASVCSEYGMSLPSASKIQAHIKALSSWSSGEFSRDFRRLSGVWITDMTFVPGGRYKPSVWDVRTDYCEAYSYGHLYDFKDKSEPVKAGEYKMYYNSATDEYRVFKANGVLCVSSVPQKKEEESSEE